MNDDLETARGVLLAVVLGVGVWCIVLVIVSAI